MTRINQSYYQRKSVNYACKLSLTKFRTWSTEELNGQLPVINAYKDSLSESIGWYLEHHKELKCELDIERKCRALGIPAFLTGVNIDSPELKESLMNIVNSLRNYSTKTKNLKIKKPCRVDMNELFIYSKMYQEIEYTYSRFPHYFPHGNPFTWIMELMNLGAIIIRFKYIKIADEKPEEKLITYHLSNYKKLLIHIEGDNYFMGWKYWGEGDEKIRTDYDIKIRWGIDDFNKKKRFTY